MTDDEILSVVTNIVRGVVGNESIALTFDSNAQEVPGWDSMAHISIIVALEHEFRMKFQTAALEEAQSVRDLVALIKEK